MRKIVSTIFIAVIGISFSFAKELEGKNLQAVKIVLEAKLICKTLLIKQKETAKANDELKKEANQKRKSPAEPGTNLKTFPARNM